MRVLILLLPLIILIACNNDDDSPIPMDEDPVIPAKALSKIFKNDSLKEEFFYDDEGILIRMKFNATDGSFLLEDTFETSGDTIIRVSRASNGGITYSYKYYEIPGAFREDIFQSGEKFLTHSEYFDSSDDCGFQEINFFDEIGIYNGGIKFDYNSGNCSFTYNYFDKFNVLIFTREITRDDINIPKLEGVMKYMHPFDERGITSFISKDTLGVINSSSSWNSIFKYNEANQPTEEIRTYYNDFVVNFRFEYE